MKINSFNIALLFLFSFSSCNKDSNQRLILSGEFPVSDSVELSSMPGFDEICPENLVFHNGYLVINNNCHDQLIQIVRTHDSQTKHFIRRGRGPGEMFQANFSGHISGDSILMRNTPESSFWINPDLLFNGERIGNNRKVIEVFDPAIINQNENVFNIGENWIFNDYSSNRMHNGFFVFLNSKGEIEKKTDYIPALSYTMAEDLIGYAYLTTTRINKSQTRFVSALKYFPYFIITNIDGEYELIVQTEEDYIEPKFKEGEINPEFESEFFYGSVLVSENHIFLYRLNLPLSALVDYFSDQKNQPLINTGFEVYTWQGRKVCYLEVNKLLVSPSIDFENGIIYGLEFDPESGYDIVKGNIPEKISRLINND